MQKQIHHYPQRPTRYNSPYQRTFSLRVGDLGGGSLTSHPYKILCPNCRRADKISFMGIAEICRICGGKVFMIAPRARVPRKLASTHTWDKFLRRFCRKALEISIDE